MIVTGKMIRDFLQGEAAQIPKSQYKKLDDGIVIYTVDGKRLRDEVDVQFRGSGNGFVYPFIPKNEIWIQSTTVPRQVKFKILRQLVMVKLMQGGVRGDAARKIASQAQRRARQTHGETL